MTKETEKDAGAGADAGSIGRGALFLTMTKLWFMVSGYVIYFGLPRIFGSGEAGKALFGKYNVAIGLASIANALAVQGTTQAVSRFVGRGEAGGVRAAAIKLQSLLGGGAFLLLFLGAPYFARWYGDESLTLPLRCSAFITLFYSFYGIYLGWLNGSRLFGRQALVDFSFSTMKVIGVLAGAMLLARVIDPVAGAITGWAAAAFTVLLLGRALSGPPRGEGQVTVSALFNFQLFTMLVAGAATGIAKADIQVAKIALRHYTEMSKDAIDAAVGEYSAGQMFATIPYQAVFAITFILFPLVSAASGRDLDKIKGYVRQTTRYAAMIAGLLCTLFIACPERTITILYKAEYAAAAPILRYLALGYFCYSVFFILVSIITASGRPGLSFLLVLSTLILQVLVGYPMVGLLGIGGAAVGTLSAMVAALLIAHLVARGNFGRGLDLSMLARVAGIGLVVGLVAHALLARSTFWSGAGLLAGVGGTGIVAKLVTLVGFGICSIAFVVLLAVTGVIDAEDRARFGRILKRGR